MVLQRSWYNEEMQGLLVGLYLRHLVALATAEKIVKEIKIEENRFKLGNLLPYVHSQSKDGKAISHFRIKQCAYEESTREHYQYFEHERFLSKYAHEMNKVPQLLQALDRDFKVEFKKKNLGLLMYSDIEKYINRTSDYLVSELKRIRCK